MTTRRPTSEEIRVVKAVVLWLGVRAAADPRYDAEWLRQLFPDAFHSALLWRLLDGRPVLPKPPPVAFSYPWYDLIDDGEAVASDWMVEFHLQGIQDPG